MESPLRELPVERLARQLNRTFNGVACAFSTPREGTGGAAVEVVEWIARGPGAEPIKRVHADVTGSGGAVALRCRHRLGVPLAADGHRAFVVGRHVGFAQREIDLAKRIRRLIVGLDQQARMFAAGCAGPVSARITPREQAVLGELARGVTAAVISRRLGISERTVHKHLEHIYSKLDVTDRLSAVLRARETGLIAGS